MVARRVAWLVAGAMVGAAAGGVSACGGDSGAAANHPDGGGSASGAASGVSSGSGGSGSAGPGSGSPSGASSGGSGSASGGGDGGGGSGSSGGGDGGNNGASPASVLEFHKSPTRDGVYVDGAFAASTGVKTLHLDTTFSVTVTGNVYAQPLYVQNGPNGGEMFIVATEANHLVAVDATGKVLWDNPIGPAVSSGLPCGNVSPLGITGTPVIDTASTPPTIYFDTMTTGPKHVIHGVSLVDGKTEQSGFPIDVSAKITGFDSPHQSQRGALLLLNNILYVPYGGHYGDCQPYYGYVVGVPLSSPGSLISWHTKAIQGGIWASGGVASDGTSIFAATGNTAGTGGTWGDGEGILKLTSMLTFTGQGTDYFTPSAWATYDATDNDLGTTGPVLFQISGARYALALGKDSTLYLLNRDNLGGVGGALSSTVVASGGLYGAGAVYTTSQGTYVAFRGTPAGCPAGTGGGNLGAAKITPGTPPTAKVVWCVAEGGLGSPIATTSDGTGNVIVWDANTRLYGYDGDTGMKVFLGGGAGDVMAARMHKFGSPIVANGRIVIATSSDNNNPGTPEHLYVFKP